MRCGRELPESQSNQVRYEEEKPATAGGQGAWAKGKGSHVGDRLGPGAHAAKSFLVEAARKGRETLFLQDLAHGGGTEEHASALELLADLVNRVVLLPQFDDQVAGGGLLGLEARTAQRLDEEGRVFVPPELMTKDPEGPRGVAEGLGDIG